MKYYITSPIYYVNATPHIGHAYTTLVCDTVKRFRQMMGDEVHFTTGTDEHGTNVARSAENAGWEPKKFADRVSNAFRQEWDELGFNYDYYQRTTSPEHAKAVYQIFRRCMDNGAIYKGSYAGKYHVGDEAFVTDAEAAQADPDRIIEITEENYFFKLSAYQEKLEQFYADQPDFIEPESRRNEVLSFVKEGLKDLSITRSKLKWGVPLKDDPEHVFYVWFDALTAYMSAIGYGQDDPSLWEKLWPADVHLVGKEILRFHAVYWPAFLMAAGLPLPKKVYAHGWLIFQGDKMSKSKGNIVRSKPINQVVGIEGLRYYLLRDIVFGQDGNFSYDGLVGRYNSDLANGIGNLTSRTVTMVQRYTGGIAPDASQGPDGGLPALAAQTIPKVIGHYEKFEFNKALEATWALLSAVDKYIVEQKPWLLAKDESPEGQAALAATLYNSAETLRIGCALVYPVLPKSAPKIWAQLGQASDLGEYKLAELAWGGLEVGTRFAEPKALFPRLEVDKAVKEMEELEQEVLKEQAEIMGRTFEPASEALVIDTPEVEIDDFFKVDMRVGMVKSAEKVAKTDKLLHLMIDIGETEPRSIVAGVAKAYEPEALIGRKVAIVANLKPRKMRGIESQGMIIAASGDDHHPYLVSFLEEAPIGARLG